MNHQCGICEAKSQGYLCDSHIRELKELLIGSNDTDGQPGIVWYLFRLKEQAYRQSHPANGRVSPAEGWAQLPDARAVDLLFRIRVTLETWVLAVWALICPTDERSGRPLVSIQRRVANASEATLARWLATQMRTLTRVADVARLHADLYAYARAGWAVINPPPDVCCGPCPTPSKTQQGFCGTLLYADENSTFVQCPKCREHHDVAALREALREQARDLLFTAGELLRLTQTRLGDAPSRATFYRMIKDGRLTPRSYTSDETPLYTYDDLCAAREKGTKKARTG